MVESGLRHEAQTGFSSAAAYDLGRPSYSDECVDLLLERLKVKGVENAKILELAAGTGKFTAALSSRPEAFAVVAVEPHDEMRKELVNKQFDRVNVRAGTAEHLEGLQDGEFATVIAAQSFHWFANMTALKEIARVLKPAGTLGMVWNIDDYNAPLSWDVHPGWDTEMRKLVWTLEDAQPRFRHEKWKAVFDEQAKSDPLTLHFADPLFSLPIGEESIPYTTWLSKEGLWRRLRTLSQLAILEGEELKKVEDLFEKAVKSEGTEMDDEGRIALHGRTVVSWTSRIPDVPLRSGG